MRAIHVHADEATIERGRRLTLKYGRAVSFSSVVRRAIELLESEWDSIGDTPRAVRAEHGAMLPHLSRARRGNGLRSRD